MNKEEKNALLKEIANKDAEIERLKEELWQANFVGQILLIGATQTTEKTKKGIRLIDAHDLWVRVGAVCLNEEITTEEALCFKKIIESTPTVESHDIKMELSGGMNICFHHVPSMMGSKEE